jgi:hypothetical protein
MKTNLKLSDLYGNNKLGPNKDITFENINDKKSEFPILIEIESSEDEDLLKTTNDLAEEFSEDVLIFQNNPELGAGPQEIWYEVKQAYHTIIQIKEFIDLGIFLLSLENQFDKFKKLFKDSVKTDEKRPPLLRFPAANGSYVEFKFFYYFSEESIKDGINTIYNTFKSMKFIDNEDQIMVFDPKQKKWFLEKIRHIEMENFNK